MPWPRSSLERLALALEHKPEWVARRLLEIGVERALSPQEAAELSQAGADSETVCEALVLRMEEAVRISREKAVKLLGSRPS